MTCDQDGSAWSSALLQGTCLKHGGKQPTKEEGRVQGTLIGQMFPVDGRRGSGERAIQHSNAAVICGCEGNDKEVCSINAAKGS